MEKIEVRILGLSYSQSQIGSYVLVLSEINGSRKIPIVIKQTDAQYIALNMEGIKQSRPSTQDLIRVIVDNLGGDIQEVYIHSITEGIFYARLILSDMVDEFDIECTVGDAVSLSLAFDCPIMISQQVMSATGVQMDADGVVDEEAQSAESKKDRKSSISIENLEKMLEKSIENEEYEISSQLRDRIKEIKGE